MPCQVLPYTRAGVKEKRYTVEYVLADMHADAAQATTSLLLVPPANVLSFSLATLQQLSYQPSTMHKILHMPPHAPSLMHYNSAPIAS